MIATAIITAPRPRPTIAQSLSSYRRAFFSNIVHVMSDGPCPLQPRDDLFIEVHSQRKGNFRNWVHALQSNVAQTDQPWLMVCEDDITWAKYSAQVLATELLGNPSLAAERVGGLSLYLPRRHSLEPTRRSGHRLDRGWHHEGLQRGLKAWGFQCTMFSRAQAIKLLTSPVLIAYLASPKHDKNVDGIVQECINSAGRVMLYRVPCLVSHELGEGNSSLGYEADRPMLKTDYFTGWAA